MIRPAAPLLKRRDLLIGTGAIASTALLCKPANASNDLAAEAITRGIVSYGNTSRLARVMAKAARGEPVTLGFIGGSITQGAMASEPSRNYAALVETWWRARFPNSLLTSVNAGLGGTGSLFGAFRVKADLLVRDPDLVIVEYAVNDAWTDTEPFEGLIRQILGHRTAPAALVMFMMWENGGNSQDMQMPVGRHYALPMLSFRDAVWPQIEAGHLAWRDVIADTVHPNDLGHRQAAQLCTSFFDRVLREPPPQTSDKTGLPSPLRSSLYTNVRYAPAARLTPAYRNGWQFTRGESGESLWTPMRETTKLEFDFMGSGAALILNGPSARLLSHATLTIDDTVIHPMAQQPFFDRETVVLATGLPRARHRLRIESTGLPQGDIGRIGLRGLGLFDDAAAG